MKRIPEDLLNYARELRKNQTDAETLIWHLLRGRRLDGYKFRRQKPVNRYILDFYCPKKKLAVELDGGQHASHCQSSYDARRTALLHSMGIRVLRFWDNQVLTETEAVLESIWHVLQDRSS